MWKDKLYYQRVNGSFEAWTYSEGRTVYVFSHVTEEKIMRYAKEHDYQLIFVPAKP